LYFSRKFQLRFARHRQAPKRQAVKKLATLQKIAQTSVIPALNLAFAQCAF
jgi:hypothetical protein